MILSIEWSWLFKVPGSLWLMGLWNNPPHNWGVFSSPAYTLNNRVLFLIAAVFVLYFKVKTSSVFARAIIIIHSIHVPATGQLFFQKRSSKKRSFCPVSRVVNTRRCFRVKQKTASRLLLVKCFPRLCWWRKWNLLSILVESEGWRILADHLPAGTRSGIYFFHRILDVKAANLDMEISPLVGVFHNPRKEDFHCYVRFLEWALEHVSSASNMAPFWVLIC